MSYQVEERQATLRGAELMEYANSLAWCYRQLMESVKAGEPMTVDQTKMVLLTMETIQGWLDEAIDNLVPVAAAESPAP